MTQARFHLHYQNRVVILVQKANPLQIHNQYQIVNQQVNQAVTLFQQVTPFHIQEAHLYRNQCRIQLQVVNQVQNQQVFQLHYQLRSVTLQVIQRVSQAKLQVQNLLQKDSHCLNLDVIQTQNQPQFLVL